MTDTSIGSIFGQSSAIIITIVSFIVVAYYNVLELNFIIFSTFKNRRSLYFWSFLISTWGVAANATGFLIKDLQVTTNSTIYSTVIIVGWCCMVTGQSVVLYSRLHLILRNPTTLRLVLAMIIVDAMICHIPITVIIIGENATGATSFVVAYSIYEKVQVTIFFFQELIISGLYIIHTVKILRTEGNIRGKARKQAMAHLVYVNVCIVILDVTILALEYSGLYDVQTAYKAFAYSLKLKLEFSILNRLVNLMKSSSAGYVHNSHNHSQLGAERNPGGMRTDNFDGTLMSRRDSTHRPHQQRAGYRAYVHTGERIDASGIEDEDFAHKDHGTVIMTTEIAVRSDAIEGLERFESCDEEATMVSRRLSFSGKSAVTGTSMDDVADGLTQRNCEGDMSGSRVRLAATGH